MRHRLVRAVVVVTALLGATTARAQAALPLPNVQRLGPQVGERVPDFSLLDQHGERRTLASLMGPKGLMLVFFRSADWCPYCKTQLADLQAQLSEIARSGLGLAAVSYDSVAVLKEFAGRRAITFPLLSDTSSPTIRRYGIFNTTIPESNRQSYGIPFPGTFIVDRRGIVQRRFFEPAYQERVTVRSQLLQLGTTLAVPLTTVSSPQARITTFVSDVAVNAGARFSIVFDIVPTGGTHIYAPGVAGYQALQLVLNESSAYRAAGVSLPPSEEYVFKPLAERVQVFQKPFRMTQDVVIDASAVGQQALGDRTSLTINGTLSYQACDDRVCFAPQAVPLSWTVALRPLDRERSPVAGR